MFPILIIQTQYTTVVYIQGNKYIQQSEIHPLQWMKIGEIGARLGIQDYSIHIKKIFIMDNEVSVGIDLTNFPDRVEYLHQEIVNIILGHSSESVEVKEEVKAEENKIKKEIVDEVKEEVKEDKVDNQ